MKKISILLLLFLIPLSALEQVHWMTLGQAIEAQKKEPRKILIDFYANWCAPCKEMEKDTYTIRKLPRSLMKVSTLSSLKVMVMRPSTTPITPLQIQISKVKKTKIHFINLRNT